MVRLRRYHAGRKPRSLHPRRSYFAPAETQSGSVFGFWWRRRVLPPGPKGLLQRAFIAIAGLRQHNQYRRAGATMKGPGFGQSAAGRGRVLLEILAGSRDGEEDGADDIKPEDGCGRFRAAHIGHDGGDQGADRIDKTNCMLPPRFAASPPRKLASSVLRTALPPRAMSYMKLRGAGADS